MSKINPPPPIFKVSPENYFVPRKRNNNNKPPNLRRKIATGFNLLLLLFLRSLLMMALGTSPLQATMFKWPTGASKARMLICPSGETPQRSL